MLLLEAVNRQISRGVGMKKSNCKPEEKNNNKTNKQTKLTIQVGLDSKH